MIRLYRILLRSYPSGFRAESGEEMRAVFLEAAQEAAAIFVVILMPAIVALSLIVDFWDVRAFPRIWGYVLGVPWLMLGIWLFGQRGAGRITGTAA